MKANLMVKLLTQNRKAIARIVIPMHPGKDVKPGLTRAILKEAGLSGEEFQKFLKKK